MNVRTLARQAIRRAGFEKIHHPSFVDLLLREQVATILDVGANDGRYGVDLRERGFIGHIVSFEPITSVYETLAGRAVCDPLWDTHQLGVGDANGELSIAVSAASVFSSFKAPSHYTAGKFTGAKEVRRETVPVIRIDSFLSDKPDLLANCFLKIDTQGFEHEVLAGAGDMLTRFRGIQLELPLRQLYENQPLWLPMIEWMAGRGFSVAMLKENGFDWQAMRLLEVDVLFWRDD